MDRSKTVADDIRDGVAVEYSDNSVETSMATRPLLVTQNFDATLVEPVYGLGFETDLPVFYLRRFAIGGSHGMTRRFTVNSVQFGIASASPGTVDIRLYSIPTGAAFTFANMTLIGRAPFTFSRHLEQVLEDVAVTGTIDTPATTDLVAAVVTTREAQTAGFFIGFNLAGDSAQAYYAMPDSGTPEPTGFRDQHFSHSILISVTGSEEALLSFFAPQTDVTLDSVIDSNTICIAGLNGPSTLKIEHGSYSLNGAPFSAADAWIGNGDTLRLRLRSSSAASTTTAANAVFGGKPHVFAVRTLARKSPPDASTSQT